MTWDEALEALQGRLGGERLGSVAENCPSGLLHTRIGGTAVTLSAAREMDKSGRVRILAAAPAELERPVFLEVSWRLPVPVQSLLSDYKPCSTGREELDRELYVECSDPDFPPLFFGETALSALLLADSHTRLILRPAGEGGSLHTAVGWSARPAIGFDGQLYPSFPQSALNEEETLKRLEGLLRLAAAAADAARRWR